MRKLVYPLLLLLLLSLIPTTQAANFTVLTPTDLITAINTANSNGQDDVITLADNINLTGTDNLSNGNNGLPSILPDGGHRLTIEGAGFTLAGNNTDFRLLHVASGANLSLNNLSLNRGFIYNNNGGAIYSQGALTITNSTIALNTLRSNIGGDFFGGAIYATGTSLSISNSTFNNNNLTDVGGVIRGFGGAIGVENLGTLEITESSFFRNNVMASTLASGGALALGSNVGTSLLENNLFSDHNVSSALDPEGGALRVSSDNFIARNNTFYQNNATGGTSSGGAVMLAGGSNQSFINNTFVANYVSGSSLSGAALASNVADTSRIITNNLFAQNTGANECENMTTGTNNASDGTCAGTVALNPAMGADVAFSPANNGGTTLTMALPAGSMALDAASATDCPATDQRGFSRPADGDNNGSSICDIGAFELVGSQAYFLAISSTVLESGGLHSVEITVIIAQTLSSPFNLLLSDAGTGSATASSDYIAFAPQTITFPAGTPAGTYTRTVDITILDDSLVESVELLDLTLTNAAGGITGSPSTHAVAIIDDELTTRTVTLNGGGTADTDFVFKTVDNPFATVGQTVIYTIRARNPKTIPLSQVVIYDVFDERLTDIQLLSTSHGAGTFNANTLTVSGFTLRPNEEALIVVSARIASLRAGETIPNAAILESPNASVHVSNLALVGDNPQANNGGAAQVFIIPSQLPSTGESPLWRYGVFVGLGMLLFLGLGGSFLHKRRG